MAISRPFLLALLGVALLGATVFAVSNARNASSDKASSATQQPASPAAPASEPAAPTGPQQVLQGAFSFDAVKSASFNGRLAFNSNGKRNSIRTSGAFESTGATEMPHAAVQVSLRVPRFNGSGGFVTTGDRAWLTKAGVGYAVPQAAWSKIVKARAKGSAPTKNAPKLDVNPSSWLDNVKSEGTARMDGVQVTHVSADVNSARAIADVARTLDTTARIPANAEQRLAKGIKGGHLDVWVGDDKIMRRASFDMSGKGTGGRRVDVKLDFALSRVNKPQTIERPRKVKAGLPSGTFGQFAAGFVAGLGNTVGVTAADLRLGVPVTNAHRKAERAVAQNKKVVIFFKNPRALDDQAVADSVRSLERHTTRVVVLTDDVRNADHYGSLLEDLQVNQAPAIVVIGHSGKASLIEGYVDANSLVQVVADAR
jgi:hypothetical protein